MVRDYLPGKALKKDGAWVSSWKKEEWKWMKVDLGVYSKHSRQQMKMIWTKVAIPVYRLGTHSDNEEEDRNDRVGTYRGIRAAR